MKIYFAGSIRGGRDDKEHYALIISMLKKHGEVLSEHIGDKDLTAFGQTTLSDQEIFEKDTAWIRESDIIVAEVTTPSLGVGYEIGYAEGLGKKIILLYRTQEGKRLSAMLAGNGSVTTHKYSDPKELGEYFERVL